MINVTDEIKQAYDISTTQVDKIIVGNQEYRIKNVEYYDDTYEDGNIFGTAIARCLDFEIENTVCLENKEIEYQTGIIINGFTHWISLGNFIIQSVEPNDTTNINKITAMDYMLKTNIPYVSTLNYSDGTVTLLDVLQEACTNSGMKLATMNFANSDFIVTSNQFEEGTLNRQVIQAVAQISGTVAKIKSDNSLYLINPNKITTISKVFTLNNYKEAEIKRNTHPINVVSLGMADIEGENITLRDEESIKVDGENTLAINDNPFAYTQSKREQLITALFNAVKGFEYKAYTLSCQGLPHLETMDKVQFQDKEGNIYDSYLFRFNYKSPNGLESTIEAPSIIKATVNYQNIPDALEISKRTEIIVDKQNQKIESVVNSVTEQNDKISKVTQTVDELNSKISDIADITTSGESIYGKLEFTSINQSEPILVKIHPLGTNISYLYPHSNLYPSSNLYPTTRVLRFTTKDSESVERNIDYHLPDDLLYYDGETYDEFILSYDSQICQVIKRCGYNEDGTVYKLEKEIVTDYEYPKIELIDGDYTVSLLGYDTAYLYVTLMAQNIYTTQFATKAEVSSEINQTAQDINLSVDKKLTLHPTTTEMNSAINMTANSITSTVSQNYATKTELSSAKSEIKQTTDSITSTVSKKVGNDEVISKINQSAETVGINANKIELSANDILNLLAGNTINLTSKNIIISSDKFKLDKSGKVTCSDLNVTGGTISLDYTGGLDVFRVIKDGNTKTMAYITNDVIAINNNSKHIELVCGDTPSIHVGEENGYSTRITNSMISTRGINSQNIYDNNNVSNSPNMYITSSGNVRRTTNTSSERYKTDITNEISDELNPERLYDLEVKQFKYKEEYQPNKEDMRYNKDLIGFIAEDVAKVFPIASDYEKDEKGNHRIENWNERYFTPAMLKLIQNQHKVQLEQQAIIEELQKQIKEMKGE